MKQQIEINKLWEAAEVLADQLGMTVNDYVLELVQDDMRKWKLERTTAELSDELLARLEVIAEREGVSVSVMVGRLFRLGAVRRQLIPA